MIDAPTPGYDDPTWGKPHIIPREEALEKGFSQCKNCSRKMVSV
jgi:hypothetical protein